MTSLGLGYTSNHCKLSLNCSPCFKYVFYFYATQFYLCLCYSNYGVVLTECCVLIGLSIRFLQCFCKNKAGLTWSSTKNVLAYQLLGWYGCVTPKLMASIQCVQIHNKVYAVDTRFIFTQLVQCLESTSCIPDTCTNKKIVSHK